MPSFQFNLSSSDIPLFSPMPGHALLRVLPVDLSYADGLLVLPEKQADEMEKMKAVRFGEVIWVNNTDNKYQKTHMALEDLMMLTPGRKVWYLGHGDEMESEYVVVMHGQIVGVME